MRILVIHNVGVNVYKLEYDSPVAAHLDSPPSLSVAFKRVQPPARNVHVVDAEGGVKGLQSPLNARFVGV